MPADPSKFNFVKASTDEDLLMVMDDGARSVVKVNISPIINGHVLYTPYIDEILPQFIDSVRVLSNALSFYQWALKGNKDLLMGYNSVGAQSSINHLHFQLIDLRDARGDNESVLYGDWLLANLPVEPTEHCIRQDSANDYLFSCRVIKIDKLAEEGALLKAAERTFELLSAHHLEETPYNLLFKDDFIVIVPRTHQLDFPQEIFGPALLEMYGIWINRRQPFDEEHA